MAVNQQELKVNFISADGKRYRIYITNDAAKTNINTQETNYTFLNTLSLGTETIFKAFELDALNNIKDSAYIAYGLISNYDRVLDKEQLTINTYLVDKTRLTLLQPPVVTTKDISTDRSISLSFKVNLIDGFNPGAIFTANQLAELSNNIQSSINTTSYGVDFGNSFEQVLVNQLGGTVTPQPTSTTDTGTTSTTKGITLIPDIPPKITDINITDITEFSAKINWFTIYPSDGKVIFVGTECPEVIGVEGLPVKQCETQPFPVDYKTDVLVQDHSIDVYGLKPNTTYKIALQSRFVSLRSGDITTLYPNPEIATETYIEFKTKELPNLDPDVLLFEVVFGGNYKDSPDMYYDQDKTLARSVLKFDYNQEISSKIKSLVLENGRYKTVNIDVGNPILDQKIPIFGNTDKLVTFKSFINTPPKPNLGFILSEDFEKDLDGKPIFIRDSIYYSVNVADTELQDGDFTINVGDIVTSTNPNGKWKRAILSQDGGFLISASELLNIQPGEFGNRLLIVATYKKRLDYIPVINIPDKDGLSFEVPFSEKDLERIIEIPYNGLKFANAVQVYIGDNTTPVTIPLTTEKGIISLSYLNNFGGKIGNKVVQINPVYITTGQATKKGVSTTFEIKILAVDDFPNILKINRPTTINVPSYGNLNANYNLYFTATLETNYVEVFTEVIEGVRTKLIRLSPLSGNQRTSELVGAQNEFRWSFNIYDTIESKFPLWDKKEINLVLIPYSSKKISDPLYSNPNDIKGLEYPILTTIIKPDITITLPQVKKLLLDMMIKSVNLKSPEENKYLSHLANFGNDNQILISSWEDDNWTLSKKETDKAGNEIVTDEIKSVIVKLYNPLPENISTNSTFWITQLLANPIIETVILQEDIPILLPKLRGPNFNVPVDYVTGQSTAYESLDTLIISSSVSSSATLIEQYLSKGIIDTNGLNIEYASGSINDGTAVYMWENFVHFSSAKERVNNFVYKVQLIERYESAISSSLYDPTSLGHFNSFTVKKDIDLQTEKKNKVIGGFDGFEKFLYASSSQYTTNTYSSITWPYNNGVRMSSTLATVSSWYSNILEFAEEFDRENLNSVYNSIPSYIKSFEDNEQMSLFITLIGQHFDILYYFNKAIERSRPASYKSNSGISNKLLYQKLKSFNWDAKNLSVNSKLWEYVLGMDTNGNIKYSNPARERNNEIWRRILNNLPYLLKHKGTKRAIHALLACYGIPSSNLSILEFGGPEIDNTTTNKAKFLIENVSNAIKLESNSKITTLWTNTPLARKPETIELFIKPAYAGNWTVVSGSGWSLNASGSNGSNYGKVLFTIGATNYLTSSLLPIFNGDYFGVALSATTGSVNYNFELNIAQNKQERRIFLSSTTASISTGTAGVWQTAGQVAIGSGYSGSVDEFRLWSTPLNSARFLEHVAFPEMVNGNNISSSTEDLFFRLDFEYPKNVTTYTTTPNVDNNIYYSQSLSRNDIETTTIRNGVNIFSETSPAVYSASFSGFTSVTSYPYQFEVIERNSVLEMPDMGIQRYSNNKIRFEAQTLFNNQLFKDYRNTVKAYDKSPIDSNKLGLFFSPTKELNIDIAKSFGGINLDNYIGDPRDQYKDNYSNLDALREYYFNRFDGRDIYAYINLVKMYEQNLFEDIKQLVPARAKLTTGILIEPHILERSKIARKRPSAENNQYDTTIEYDIQNNLSGENNQYETTLNAEDTTVLFGEANQYETDINTIQSTIQSAEATQYEGDIITQDIILPNAEATQYEGNLDTRLNKETLQSSIDWYGYTLGNSDFENYGLGLYMEQPGIAIRNFYDRYGIQRKERVRVNLITKQRTKFYRKYSVTLPNGLGDVRGGTELTSSLDTETTITIQPFNGTSSPNVGGEIIAVTPAYGYLPTHYKYTQDNSTGLQNSFYYGCKIVGTSVIDGKPVVEEFNTNPNTLRVNKFGRDTNEPILEVE